MCSYEVVKCEKTYRSEAFALLGCSAADVGS